MENNETDPYPLDIDDTEKRHYMTSKVMKERDKERQRNRDRETERLVPSDWIWTLRRYSDSHYRKGKNEREEKI